MLNADFDIFISYTRADSDFVDRLEADLHAKGLRTWIDRRNLEGGQRWNREIQTAIDACKVLFVVLSPQSIESDYVEAEYTYALNDHKIVVPIYYRPCKIPLRLTSIQTISFEISYSKGLNDLIHSLETHHVTADTTITTSEFDSPNISMQKLYSQFNTLDTSITDKAVTSRQAPFNRRFLYGTVTICILILVIVAYKKINTTMPNTSTGSSIATGQPSAGGYGAQILCQSGEQFTQHIHANVQIVINGKNEPIPAGVGIDQTASCYYWLHTHDSSGVIHIESPHANEKYLLGDFLAIWQKFPDRWISEGKPLVSTTSFFGMPVDQQHNLTVYVNQQKFTGDPNILVLQSQENIWLEYGSPLVMPTNYNFTANGLNP